MYNNLRSIFHNNFRLLYEVLCKKSVIFIYFMLTHLKLKTLGINCCTTLLVIHKQDKYFTKELKIIIIAILKPIINDCNDCIKKFQL